MKNRSAIQKALLALVILGLITAVCWLVFVSVSSLLAGQAPADTGTSLNKPSDALAMPEDYLPQKIEVGDDIGKALFYSEDMKPVSVGELSGREKNGCWIVFWASWCPDCRAMLETASEMKRIAKENGYSLVMADRLDNEKETVEGAKSELEELGISDVVIVYDKDEGNYQSWGMKSIPGSVVVGSDETVRAYYSGSLTPGEMDGLLRLGTMGREAAAKAFITERFSNEEGGVYCNSAAEGTIPSGHDVLSESMGILLEYAVLTKDRALFEKTLNYVGRHMRDASSLVSWYAAENGKRGSVNAVLDDLRILSAMQDANRLWNNAWEEETAQMAEAFLEKCLSPDGIPVDFVEFETGAKANTIALVYLDVTLLRKLAELDERFEKAAEQSQAILTGGYIGDEFPLYYAGYNLDLKVYNHADLNTAEALYTVWILARAGLCPKVTHDWLRERVEYGDLGARYEVNGKVVSGYDYHSAAVYGLAALIAEELHDEELARLALRRMERYCTMDAGLPEFGALGRPGEVLYSFDQLIAMLAYHGMG